MFKKNINKEIGRIVRISTYIVGNDVFKVKSEYLIFKTSIANMKTYLLVDNENEAEFIDKSFIHANKISFSKLKELINFIFRNSKIVQKFTKKALVNIIIKPQGAAGLLSSKIRCIYNYPRKWVATDI